MSLFYFLYILLLSYGRRHSFRVYAENFHILQPNEEENYALSDGERLLGWEILALMLARIHHEGYHTWPIRRWYHETNPDYFIWLGGIDERKVSIRSLRKTWELWSGPGLYFIGHPKPKTLA
jgi:hypothetical protein